MVSFALFALSIEPVQRDAMPIVCDQQPTSSSPSSPPGPTRQAQPVAATWSTSIRVAVRSPLSVVSPMAASASFWE